MTTLRGKKAASKKGAIARVPVAAPRFCSSRCKPRGERPRAGGEDPRSSVERILRHGACANAGGEIFNRRQLHHRLTDAGQAKLAAKRGDRR